MADAVRSRQGYLVIADISGYTAFLTATELEHAQSIIEELIALIRNRLVPALRFVKLEGDAVFCYAHDDAFADGERLVELLEVCYCDFSNLLFNMARATTCQCVACASIGSLGLKFVVHFGTFVVQRNKAGEDLAGPDVILVHRLLKNGITGQTGIAAYAFFTDACLGRLPPSFNLRRYTETIEPFAPTSGGVHDLAPVLREMRDARREYVTADDADWSASIAVRHPPSVVWQYIVNPEQRLRWACVMMNKTPDAVTPNSRGRNGIGTKSHCNHSPAEAHREIIDWRPFNYFTTRGMARFRGGLIPARPIIETFELTAQDDGNSLLSYRVHFVGRSRVSTLTLRAAFLLLRGGVRHGGDKLRDAVEQDLGRAAG